MIWPRWEVTTCYSHLCWKACSNLGDRHGGYCRWRVCYSLLRRVGSRRWFPWLSGSPQLGKPFALEPASASHGLWFTFQEEPVPIEIPPRLELRSQDLDTQGQSPDHSDSPHVKPISTKHRQIYNRYMITDITARVVGLQPSLFPV